MDMQCALGIDIGSTCAKTVAMDPQGSVIWKDVRPTGWSSIDTANAIYRDLAERENGEESKAGKRCIGGETLTENNIYVVATGYGRVSVPFANRCVTEISCHAKGAVWIFGEKDLNVIDIGGQDTKIIVVEDGCVSEFVMNDKCSAGTGRFLEVMSNTLSVSPSLLCEMARQGRKTHISSLCTVFAESEITGLIGKGTPREDIAWGVVDSIVQKVKGQAGKLRLGNGLMCLTGGFCDFPFVREMMENAFRREVLTNPDARFAGAIGAAGYAAGLW